MKWNRNEFVDAKWLHFMVRNVKSKRKRPNKHLQQMTLPAVNEWIQHEAKKNVIEIKGTMQSSGGKRLRLRQNIHVRPEFRQLGEVQ